MTQLLNHPIAQCYLAIALNAGAVLVGAAAFATSALAWLIVLGWY